MPANIAVTHIRNHLNIFLDLDALGSQASEDWRCFVEQACHVVGVVANFDTFSGLPPDQETNFAYLADSRTLTRGLLRNIECLYIQALAPIGLCDPFFSWCGVAHWNIENDVGDEGYQRISLITSCYSGDEYLDGFLANVAEIDGYNSSEHLLIRAGSPGNEHARLIRHVREHSGAVYINLASDPGLYSVWNLGIRLSTGRFLSNANLDDRRAPGQLMLLRQRLTECSDISVASTPLRVTTQKNLSWSLSGDCPVWPDGVGEQVYGPESLFRETPTGLASFNLPHCMPLWRRKLHAHVGTFIEHRYGPSADWAFWLKSGQMGARFYFGGPPSGLYLRDENSYWRGNPKNAEFDRQVVLEFAHLQCGDGDIQQGVINPLVWPDVTAALDSLRGGAVLNGIGQLLHVSASLLPTSEALYQLVKRLAWDYLGLQEVLEWAGRYQQWAGLGSLPDTALFNALCDLVHAYDSKLLGDSAKTVERNLAIACVDWYETVDEMRGVLLLALLAGRHGDVTKEQGLLMMAHQRDRKYFWSTIQQVYRFITPLHKFSNLVSAVATVQDDGMPAEQYRLAYYPHYKMNSYQNRLYAPWIELGALIDGVTDPDEFVSLQAVPDMKNILHIHWINGFFKRDEETNVRESRIQRFITALGRQKERGFKVYWTIHNRLSHECADYEGELAFRRTLYQLADRVFIHHPLAAELLDWLPDTEKLYLCEHGPMGQADSVDADERLAARNALGFGMKDWVLTHVGQVRDYKGLGSALPSLYQVLCDSPNMKLVIAGQIQSTEVKQWLATHTHPRMIVRDGFLSDHELRRYTVASDMGLLTYSAILTSGSLFHWFSCGRPVLAAVSGSIAAYLVDGWNGVGFHNMDGLQDRVKFCMNLPSPELDRLGYNALHVARQLEWRLSLS